MPCATLIRLVMLVGVLAVSAAPLHDAKGNLVRNERGYGFTYDFEDRLTRVFADNAPANGVYEAGEAVYAEYVVDALGRRVQAGIAAAGGALTTTYRYYDDTLVLAEYPSGSPSSPTAVYVHGPTYLDERRRPSLGCGQSPVWTGNRRRQARRTLRRHLRRVRRERRIRGVTKSAAGLATTVSVASAPCLPLTSRRTSG